MLMVIMSRVLSELVGTDEPLFAVDLEQLEKATGMQGIDVRLTADIIMLRHTKIQSLGLDPNDTSGPELYHALIGLVKLHDKFLADKLGVKDHGNVKEVLRAISLNTTSLPLNTQTWAIKHSVIKKMLKAVPPKNVMKVLNYRSVDSLLKRESVSEILGGARFAENKAWQTKFFQQYAKLQPSDFENREVEVIYFDPKKWKNVADDFVKKTRHVVASLKDAGAILLAPLPMENMPGITITTLPVVIHYINQLRSYAAYFKIQQIKPEFGTVIHDTIVNDPQHHATMAGHGLHWSVASRHFSGKGNIRQFEPHINEDDLSWHSAESVLYKIEPALYFWKDTEYVGSKFEEGVVSFNLVDNAISMVNNLQYGYQSVNHMKIALKQELHYRYLQLPMLENQVLAQLDVSDASVDVSYFELESF